ncbi:hypothetical protein [Reyranella sp.]|jgi:hypothetical protein
MKRLAAIALILVAFVQLTGCENVPGADGRYATHDRGRNNRP